MRDKGRKEGEWEGSLGIQVRLNICVLYTEI